MKPKIKGIFSKMRIKKDKKDENSEVRGETTGETDGIVESGDKADAVEAKKSKKLIEKVSEMFNYEPEKERVLRHEDFKSAGDVYYASVSAFYKVAERFLWLILAIFMSFSLAVNYREITYNNFFYLLRDFTTAAESQASNYQVLAYDSNSRQNFALYRGGLVSVSPSTVSVFTAGGKRTLKASNEYASPNVVCCDKYVLVYDTAGSAFSVYNSFSKVHNEKLDYPITDACFSPDGAFALTTKENDRKMNIRVYGKSLKNPENIVPVYGFVFDIALSNSDGRLAALGYDEGNGVGKTIIYVRDIKDKDPNNIWLSKIELVGEFPISCSYLEDGKLAVITNRAVRIYDKKLHVETEKSYEGAAINAYHASVDGACVAVNSGIQKSIIAFDKKGKLIYNSAIGENVSDIAVCGDFLFLKTISGVIRIDTQGDGDEFLSSEGRKMLIYGEDTAIVCGDAKAEYLVFGKKQNIK